MSFNNKAAALLRQQLLIDGLVQGVLLKRMCLYGTACLLYFSGVILLTESMANPKEAISSVIFRCLDDTIYWGPGLVLLVPAFAYDLLRVSNRFAGPIFRLRREMRRLADGESKYTLSFREDDYWNELADVFNELREELHTLRENAGGRSNRYDDDDQYNIAERAQLFSDDPDEDQEESDEFLRTAGA